MLEFFVYFLNWATDARIGQRTGEKQAI